MTVSKRDGIEGRLYNYCWSAVSPRFLAIIDRFIRMNEERVDWFVDTLEAPESKSVKTIPPCGNSGCKSYDEKYFNNCDALHSKLMVGCDKYIPDKENIFL